jgi:hypothetical protein
MTRANWTLRQDFAYANETEFPWPLPQTCVVGDTWVLNVPDKQYNPGPCITVRWHAVWLEVP